MPQSTLDLALEDPVLRHQIFVLQEEFLVDRASDIGEHSFPTHGAKVNQKFPQRSLRKTFLAAQFEFFDLTWRIRN
jgi:hypothetical protein